MTKTALPYEYAQLIAYKCYLYRFNESKHNKRGYLLYQKNRNSKFYCIEVNKNRTSKSQIHLYTVKDIDNECVEKHSFAKLRFTDLNIDDFTTWVYEIIPAFLETA